MLQFLTSCAQHFYSIRSSIKKLQTSRWTSWQLYKIMYKSQTNLKQMYGYMCYTKTIKQDSPCSHHGIVFLPEYKPECLDVVDQLTGLGSELVPDGFQLVAHDGIKWPCNGALYSQLLLIHLQGNGWVYCRKTVRDLFTHIMWHQILFCILNTICKSFHILVAWAINILVDKGITLQLQLQQTI